MKDEKGKVCPLQFAYCHLTFYSVYDTRFQECGGIFGAENYTLTLKSDEKFSDIYGNKKSAKQQTDPACAFIAYIKGAKTFPGVRYPRRTSEIVERRFFKNASQQTITGK